ncbi:NUDIX domain-containing protein [Spirillospora albida]|uniref:NUDIX domain-containing protein n=1 Tax=Spirillospora albida TaxID=58123 RepID=UPI00056B6799|nr:NUDIX domain-containing protein [Spirillospora albida]
MAELIRAAGAVLWRDAPSGTGEPQVAVVHRPRYGDWSFPKGKVDPGEHVLRAAVREIEEETGVVARLGRRLPTAAYPVKGRPKQVDYWAARAVAEGAFVPDEEVDLLAWLPPDEAERRLSYGHDVDLLSEFRRGPLRTWPLVILRHASAGEKSDWPEPDELRPLDEAGRAEAAGLAGLLLAYGPARVVSSGTARCLETVLPYIRRLHGTLVTEPAFTVGETSSERATDRLLDLVGDGVPTIVCTHGEVVADLVTGLCTRLGEKVPDDPALRKGEFWVAHMAEQGIASLERHTPAP